MEELWLGNPYSVLHERTGPGCVSRDFPTYTAPHPPLLPSQDTAGTEALPGKRGGGGLSVHLGTRVSREGGNFKGGGSHLFPGAQDAEPPLRLDFDVESALHGTSSGGSSQTVRQRGGWKFLGSLQWIPGTAKSHLNEDPHPLYELQIRAGIVANCIHHWPHIGEALIHGLQL